MATTGDLNLAVDNPPREAVPHVGRTPRVDLNHGLAALKAAGQEHHPLGKNPGDVWPIATGAYRGAHFATFPIELVRRPLLATCPEHVCAVCGVAWQRSMQRQQGRLLAIGPLRPVCGCYGDRTALSQPGLVLDPFLGAGTVALTAEQYSRDWVGIELNQEYAALARRRIHDQRVAQENKEGKVTSKEDEEI